MKTQKEIIKEIKQQVNSGEIVRIQKLNDNRFIDIGTLWLSDNCKYICYQNFGQSAIKNNLKDLTWLLKVIFELSTKDTIKYRNVKTVYEKNLIEFVK